MLLAHKIELSPTNKQKTYFAKGCGISRFAYNWALDKWKNYYNSGLKPTETGLRKELNSIKRIQFPWMLEVTKVAPQQAIKDLGIAFNKFFQKQTKYPRFKKKYSRDSFRADNGPLKKGGNAVNVASKKIKLPVIGWVKMKESVRFEGQIKSVTISRRAGRFYASLCIVTQNLPHTRKNQGAIGVDLGINNLATLSNNKVFTGAKSLRKLVKHVRKSNKKVSRRIKTSNNYKKAKLALSKLHAKIYHARINDLHKLTTYLVLNYDKIAIENLNVSGMLSNKRLSRYIADQSFYEFRRQLEYKAKLYDSKITIADRFFASSKICHKCQTKNKNLHLKDRRWQCICGARHDRDLNAAINLEHLISTVSSTGIYACGAEGSGSLTSSECETTPRLKQECDIEHIF